MEIRPAVPSDLPAIYAIFQSARAFMWANGNPTQWDPSYPSPALLDSDLKKNALYVCVSEDAIVGVFALLPGEEPTYQVITEGHWHSDAPYGTIHRVASNGSVRGVAQACFDFCKQHCNYLRIDTHADNLPMQNAITKAGFRRCGIVTMADGTPRIAYDLILR